MWRPWKNSASACRAGNKRQHLSLDAKATVKNVYDTLISRGFIKQDALKEASSLTKTAVSSIRDIVSIKSIAPRQRSDFQKHRVGDCERDVIRRTIYELYEKQLVPTLDVLKMKLQQDEISININRAVLHRVISEMGFKYRNIEKKQVVMESRRLRTWRLIIYSKLKITD